jgi:hypothetical protein
LWWTQQGIYSQNGTYELISRNSLIEAIRVYSARPKLIYRNTQVAVVSSSAMAPAGVEFVDRTRRRIAVRLLPFLFILYIANYLERTSVAYAALGMSRDLGFLDSVVGMGMGIFFSYLMLQIPGALVVE